MGGDDFSEMLLERPGAYLFVGNGDSADLHNPTYDFNDDVIPVGCSWFVVNWYMFGELFIHIVLIRL